MSLIASIEWVSVRGLHEPDRFDSGWSVDEREEMRHAGKTVRSLDFQKALAYYTT